ncbi:MCP four helix bundle domain-containing protein, partial [Paludibacterium paludis]
MRVTVKHRLTLGFGILLAVIAAGLLLARHEILGLYDGIQDLTTVHVPRAEAANHLMDELNQLSRNQRLMFVDDRASDRDDIRDKIRTSQALVGQIRKALRAIPAEPDSARLQDEWDAIYRNHDETSDHLMALFGAGKLDEAKAYLLDHLRPIQSRLIATMQKVADYEETQAKKHANEAMEGMASTLNNLGIMLAVSAFIGVIAAWWITRSLMRQLGGEPDEAVQLMEQLAAGEVTSELTVKKGDTSSLFFHI